MMHLSARSWIPARKDIILSCISALLFVLSLPSFDLEALAWLAFVPLFFALENATRTRAFVLAFICGVVFWLGTVYWLVHVTSMGMFVLVLYLALYWAVFGLCISLNGPVCRPSNVFYIPALWVLLEYCRSHVLTGFPWALLAYSQAQTPAMIQIADITGAWGVSFLVMMVNAALYVSLKAVRSGSPFRKPPVISACVLLACTYLYGIGRLHAYSCNTDNQRESVRISVIQGNIPQELKWERRAQEYIMHQYSILSQQAGQDNPDLIVWPEAAVPVILEQNPESFARMQEFASSLRASLLTGAVTSRNTMYYNSAVLLQPGAGLEIYNKLHLVPFGEYIPLRSVFRFLETIVPIGEVQRGTVSRVFSLGAGERARHRAFSVLICYEDVFPELSRRFVQKGAKFLITVTNDAWYQRTSAPYQHFQASIFRAIENRVWMVRSANTGVSGFVRPDGTIKGLVSDAAGRTIFVAGYLTADIGMSGGPVTFYTRFGDWFIAAVLTIFALCALKCRAFSCAPRR
jgi:apolipoprotein N-acyltransferase